MNPIIKTTNPKLLGVSKKSKAIATEDILRHLAFDNSLQPNIISVVRTGKIIMANPAACKLLGYSKKELLTKIRSAIFDIHEGSFKKMLKQRTVEGHSIAFVTAIKKNGNLVCCEITSSIFIGEHGVEKSITTITDISQSILKQKKIDVEKEKIVADNIVLAKSKQKGIDVKKEKIVADNIIRAKSKQKSIDVKKEKIAAAAAVKTAIDKNFAQNEKLVAEQEFKIAHDKLLFHLENSPLGYIEWDEKLQIKALSKKAQEIFGWNLEEFKDNQRNGYNQVYIDDQPWVFKIAEQLRRGTIKRISIEHRVYTKNGVVKWCSWFNSVLRNTNGEVITILSLVLDITERKTATENLRQSEIRLKEAQAITHISNWEIDFVQNIHTWSDEFYSIYRLNKMEVKPSLELFLALMHPDDKDFAQKRIHETFDSFRDSSFNFRFIRNDGITRYGYSEWRFEFDENRKPLRLYGILQDITERKEIEENLQLLEKKVLEEKITKQEEITEAVISGQEKERSFLGAELHDNINQILAASKLYMETAIADEGLRKDLMIDSKSYLVSAIEEIRRLSKSLLPPSLGETTLLDTIGELIENIQQVKKLNFIKQWEGIDESLLDKKMSLAIFRIVQEQLNNILKHANAKTVVISLKQDARTLQLRIKDDGVGFDTSQKRKGIGLKNIFSRAELLKGNVIINSSPNKGCELIVNFNIG